MKEKRETISEILGFLTGIPLFSNLHEGDFFGEMAALTGMARTANVITEEDSEFLIIPSQVLKRLAKRYPALNVMLHTTIGERLSLTELPRARHRLRPAVIARAAHEPA